MTERTLWDPLAAWDAMSPMQQRAIGSLALAHLTASYGAARRPRYFLDRERAAETALNVTHAQLVQATDCAVPGLLDAPPPIDLNRIGVRMCRRCGCTDDHACIGGCSWVGPTHCSGCAPTKKAKP